MTVLEEFIQQNPKIWLNPSPGLIIAYILFNHDRENKGLTKRDLKEISSENRFKISKGIRYLKRTGEITSEGYLLQKKYFLGKELREEIDRFYN